MFSPAATFKGPENARTIISFCSLSSVLSIGDLVKMPSSLSAISGDLGMFVTEDIWAFSLLGSMLSK